MLLLCLVCVLPVHVLTVMCMLCLCVPDVHATHTCAGEGELKMLLQGKGVSLSSQFRLTYSMILNLLRVEDLKVGALYWGGDWEEGGQGDEGRRGEGVSGTGAGTRTGTHMQGQPQQRCMRLGNIAVPLTAQQCCPPHPKSHTHAPPPSNTHHSYTHLLPPFPLSHLPTTTTTNLLPPPQTHTHTDYPPPCPPATHRLRTCCAAPLLSSTRSEHSPASLQHWQRVRPSWTPTGQHPGPHAYRAVTGVCCGWGHRGGGGGGLHACIWWWW